MRKNGGSVLSPVCDQETCAVIDALNARIEFEARVDSLIDLFDVSSAIDKHITLDNVDEMCEQIAGLSFDNEAHNETEHHIM